MAAISPTVHAGPPRRAMAGARAALGGVGRRVRETASAVQRRYRRPALVVSSFLCIDAGVWHTFGFGAGMVTLGALGLVFESLTGGDDDEVTGPGAGARPEQRRR